MKQDRNFGILIAVADAEVRAALVEALGGDFHVRAVNSAAHILEILEDSRYGTAFLGWGMPGLSLPELLEILSDKRLHVKAVLVARGSDTQLRADAIDAGAEAVLGYPFDPREAVALAQKLKNATADKGFIDSFVVREKERVLGLLGIMDDMLESAVNAAMELAQDDAPVLFQGDAGTGKGLLARAMMLAGPRPLGPFVDFSARGKSAADIEAALFGTSAETGLVEKAKGGALLIHGIDEIPVRLQDRLARAIDFLWDQARFLFATRIDLHGAVLRGEFHEELWKMIEGNIIAVPSLRERCGAIESITGEIVSRYAERVGSPVKKIHPLALRLLEKYSWPGNLGELERTVTFALGRAAGSVLLPDDLPFTSHTGATESLEDLSLEESIAAKLAPLVETIDELPEGELYRLILARMERPLLQLVLDRLGGNQVKAAKALGIHRNTLRKKLRELGISPKTPVIKYKK